MKEDVIPELEEGIEEAGLEVEVPPILYRNGSEDITQRKIPGLKKFSDITLKRGITGDVDFWKWIVNALNGQVQRTSGAIVLLDENRNEVMRWKFDRAWPCKFTGATMHAGNNEIAMETVVICTESNLIDA